MVDRISNLPDQVLCHILSFLPTENVVHTSLLSKRWRPLWRSVPRLDFNDRRYIRKKKPYYCFEKFVYATILARDLQQSITSFRLKCRWSRDYFSVTHVNIWVNAAIQRRVEILDLDFSIGFTLRCCIFSCRTLVVLKLVGFNVYGFSSVELPSLKTLYLENVGFLKAQHFVEVLCGCPVLKDLEVIGVSCEGPPCRGEFKHLPQLVRADVSTACHLDIPPKAISNAGFLRIFSNHYKCDGPIPVFPNLTHLDFISWNKCEWHLILEILKQCHKLQILVLHLPISFADDWSHPSFVAECLSSNLKKCVIKNYKGIESELQFAKYIMQNSKVLRTMAVQSVWESADRKSQMLQALSLCPRTCELSFQCKLIH